MSEELQMYNKLELHKQNTYKMSHWKGQNIKSKEESRSNFVSCNEYNDL